MSAILSKETIDCTQAGRFLLSAFEVEGPRVAAAFLEETRPHLEEGDEPRPDEFLVAVMRRLRGALDHLVESEHALANAMGDESQLRQEHRETKRELAFLLVALRRMVLSQYEDPDMDNLALQGINVRDAPTIRCRAELVGERFEAPELEMLGEARFAQPIDLAPYVAEIQAKAAEMQALSEQVDEAHRATDRARINRNRAKEAYDRVYLRGARIFEDMCRFAELDGLAAKIRRRERRAASYETVDEPQESVEPEVVSAEENHDDARADCQISKRSSSARSERRISPMWLKAPDADACGPRCRAGHLAGLPLDA